MASISRFLHSECRVRARHGVYQRGPSSPPPRILCRINRGTPCLLSMQFSPALLSISTCLHFTHPIDLVLFTSLINVFGIRSRFEPIKTKSLSSFIKFAQKLCRRSATVWTTGHWIYWMCNITKRLQKSFFPLNFTALHVFRYLGSCSYYYA